jgi:hypothetical protein
MKTSTIVWITLSVVVVGGVVVYLVGHKDIRLASKSLRIVHAKDEVVSAAVLEKLHPRINIDAIQGQVVHLTPTAQQKVYEVARRMWDEPFRGNKVDLVRRVLTVVVPEASWQFTRADLPQDDARAQVWDGAAWIVELMGASAEDETRDVKTAGGQA